MKKHDRLRRLAAERLWRERFGEPPPIRADAALMLKVLEECLPSPLREGRAPTGDAAGVPRWRTPSAPA